MMFPCFPSAFSFGVFLRDQSSRSRLIRPRRRVSEELRQRLLARGTDDPESLELRLAGAVRELAEAEHYDHRVVNDDVGRAAREVLALVDATRDRNEEARG